MKKTKLTLFEKLTAKVIAAKEKKFGLKYCDENDLAYKSYLLYSSPDISTYGQYKHYASFYDGYVVLSKAELFKWYKMLFEVRTDLMFAQEIRPTKESFLHSLNFTSSKWTKKELKELRKYAETQILESSDAYYELYGIKYEPENTIRN